MSHFALNTCSPGRKNWRIPSPWNIHPLLQLHAGRRMNTILSSGKKHILCPIWERDGEEECGIKKDKRKGGSGEQRGKRKADYLLQDFTLLKAETFLFFSEETDPKKSQQKHKPITPCVLLRKHPDTELTELDWAAEMFQIPILKSQLWRKRDQNLSVDGWCKIWALCWTLLNIHRNKPVSDLESVFIKVCFEEWWWKPIQRFNP